MRKPIVLVLHQDALLKQEMQKSSEAGYQLVFVNDFKEACGVLKNKNISCVEADPHSKGTERLREIERLRKLFETIPVILYGRFADYDLVRQYGHIGVEKCVSLGDLDGLIEEIRLAIERYSFQPDARVFGIDPERCSPRIRKAIKIMTEEFLENVTVGEIAHRLGIHRATLEKEFGRECMIISAKQLLIGLRLHYATFLMQNDGLKLKDIAHLAGFADEHKYYQSFHIHLGVPASTYRKLHTLKEFPLIYRGMVRAVLHAGDVR